MNKKAYTLLQWTWGLPQTLIGAVLFHRYRRDRHFGYNGATATAWKRKDGVSLGKFIFVPESEVKPETAFVYAETARRGPDKYDGVSDSFLLVHEYGHTLQSLILGPSYLLLIGIPSMLWSRLPWFRNMRKRTGMSYYSAVFERTASGLGEKYISRRGKNGRRT